MHSCEYVYWANLISIGPSYSHSFLQNWIEILFPYYFINKSISTVIRQKRAKEDWFCLSFAFLLSWCIFLCFYYFVLFVMLQEKIMWLEKRVRITEKNGLPISFFFFISFSGSCSVLLLAQRASLDPFLQLEKPQFPPSNASLMLNLWNLSRRRIFPHYKLESVLNNTQKLLK